MGFTMVSATCGVYCGRDECSFLPSRLLVTAVPSKKSSIQPGDRVLEINGVPYTDFKDAKSANELFEKLVLDIIPGDEEESEQAEESDDDLD